MRDLLFKPSHHNRKRERPKEANPTERTAGAFAERASLDVRLLADHAPDPVTLFRQILNESLKPA